MNQLLNQISILPSDGKITCAVIKLKEGDKYWVASENGHVMAKKAFACLIEPECGDNVLLASTPNGLYILSVLERDSNDVQLILPGNTTIKTQNSSLNLVGETVNITGNKTSINSTSLQMDSLNARISLKTLCFFSETIKAKTIDLSYQCRKILSNVGKLIQKAGESYRNITGVDETKAGRIRSIARESAFTRAKSMNILAEDRIKIDASKINLG